MYIIVVTNTWTGKQYARPTLYSDKVIAENAVKKLEQACSTTNNIKNNSYTLVYGS